MKTILAILFLLNSVLAQDVVKNIDENKDSRMQWWREAKFGMFIHWGLYSVLAGEWNVKKVPASSTGEWIMDALKIPVSEYEKLLPQFIPAKFNARQWVEIAQQAGMKYIVITTKHHDGFSLWPSNSTDWSVKSTPFKRDPLKELAEACSEKGIKLCFYYSIMDWHHPYYQNPRPWNDSAEQVPNMDLYVDYMKAQIKELITNYGPVGILWFDGEWEESWTEDRAADLIKYITELQPDIIINNRVGKARSGMAGLNDPNSKPLGDYGTPEQEIPSTGIPGLDWETCMTMNNTWGYSKDDNNWKSSDMLIYNLIDITSKGGNFLLNVGPTASGLFPDSSVKILDEIGRWMDVNGESIYNTKASPFNKTSWGRCTQKEMSFGTRLYLHLFAPLLDSKLLISGLLNKTKGAYMLADKNQKLLNLKNTDGQIEINLPQKYEPYSNIVVLDIEGEPKVVNAPIIKSNSNKFVDSIVVGFTVQHEDLEIRYTLDGKLPSADSHLLINNIVLKNNAVVSARYFRNSLPVSDTATVNFSKVIPLAAANISDPVPGIYYKYFEGNWSEMPDFNSLKPVIEGTLDDINIAARKRVEFYGFDYSGYIKIPADDVYTFYLESDDGSQLFVDDKMVLNNDGLHSMREISSEIALEKGFHKIRVSYFQGSGGDGLNVSIMGRDFEKMFIPGSLMFNMQ